MNELSWGGDPNYNVYKFTWSLTDWCNYDCSYCAVKDIMRKKWDKEESPTKYKLVLTRLEKFDGDFEIELFGGEPTLHPNMEEILLRLNAMDNCKKIDIITNLSRPLSYFQKINDYKIKNLMINASLHSEYQESDFLEKVYQISKMENVKITVAVNLNSDKKYWNDFIEAINKINDWGIICSLHFLNDMPFWKANYTKEFYDIFLPLQEKMSFKKKYSFGFSDGTELKLTPIEAHSKGFDKFKAFSCTTKFFNIDHEGTFIRTCTGEIVKPVLFKRADLKNTVICPMEHCSCPVMLNAHKTKGST